MTEEQAPGAETAEPRSARAWVQVLARYREPRAARSLFELTVSLVPFVGLWALAWWALSFSGWLALAISIANAGFLVRIFAIQHDCGHGAFFTNRHLSDWLGRALGVLTLTPYDVWRRSHSIHHSTAGNLDKRGVGDIVTLTVTEYRERGRFGRFLYQLYRHPLVMFGLGPTFVFGVLNRLPFGFFRSGWRYWTSAMGTNVLIALALTLIVWFGGVRPLLFIFLPTSIIAASIGVWLFYVQHQFEEAHWDVGPDWDLHDSALRGSSHYELPAILRWMTANIGIHHVHHLYSRIPFYRLPEVLRDHGELAAVQRLTLRESLACVRLHLWDERQRKLLSFAQARAIYGTA